MTEDGSTILVSGHRMPDSVELSVWHHVETSMKRPPVQNDSLRDTANGLQIQMQWSPDSAIRLMVEALIGSPEDSPHLRGSIGLAALEGKTNLVRFVNDREAQVPPS